MTVEQAYQTLYGAALIVLLIMIGAMVIRSIIGPRSTDRIMSVNMLGTMTIAEVAILSLLLNEGYLADVAMIYAMISFMVSILIPRATASDATTRKIPAVSPMPAACILLSTKPNLYAPITAAAKEHSPRMRSIAAITNLIHSKAILLSFDKRSLPGRFSLFLRRFAVFPRRSALFLCRFPLLSRRFLLSGLLFRGRRVFRRIPVEFGRFGL